MDTSWLCETRYQLLTILISALDNANWIFSSSTFFWRATSPSLIVCLYLAYSKLLKLTATSNARSVWKITILDGDMVNTAGWSRVITIWAVNYSLLHKSRRPCRRYKQYPLMNGTDGQHISGYCVWCKPSKLHWRKIVQKPSLIPNLETPKHIATKSGKTHVWDRALPSCKFSCPSVRDVSSRQKVHIFPYGAFPWWACNSWNIW